MSGGNYAYMLRCADGSYYCGWTNDPEKRLKAHNAGTGSRYTRARIPAVLAYLEEFDTKEEAMSREWHLKKLTHAEKEALALAQEARKAGNAPGTVQTGKETQ